MTSAAHHGIHNVQCQNSRRALEQAHHLHLGGKVRKRAAADNDYECEAYEEYLVRVKEVPWRLLAIIFAGSIITASILRFVIWVSRWVLRQYVKHLMEADPEEREAIVRGVCKSIGIEVDDKKVEVVDEVDWLGEGIEKTEKGDVVRHCSELGLYFQEPNIF